MEKYAKFVEEALAGERCCAALDAFKRETLGQIENRVRAIRRAGLKDEEVLYRLIREEFSDMSGRYRRFTAPKRGVRVRTSRRAERRLPAELWDRLHYMLRNFNDRMVHAQLRYDCEINVDALKTVLICFLEKTPVLHSSFVGSPITPYWRVEDYRIDDVITTARVEADALEDTVSRFLTQHLPLESPLQMKVGVFFCGGKSVLCIIENHMCMDGGDFKYFLNALCRNYNDYVEKGISPLNLRTGSRAYDKIYTSFPREEERQARRLYKNVYAKKTRTFPLTPDSPHDHSFIMRRTIDAPRFCRIREGGKRHGATVNDLLVTAFFNSMYELAGYPDSDGLVIPCAIDLRRHLNDLNGVGLTNHSAYIQCSIPRRGGDIFQTLAAVEHSIRQFKADKYMGLHGFPLLNLAYRIMPYCLAEQAVKLGYSNPLISMSNIGVLESDKLALGGTAPYDGYMTGAIKYKPYFVLTATTLGGALTVSTCVRGNERDREIVSRFLDLYEQSLDQFAAG